MAPTIEELVYRYFNLPQTALVDNLLYEDKHMDMYNNLYNLHIHTLELHSPTIVFKINQDVSFKCTSKRNC